MTSFSLAETRIPWLRLKTTGFPLELLLSRWGSVLNATGNTEPSSVPLQNTGLMGAHRQDKEASSSKTRAVPGLGRGSSTCQQWLSLALPGSVLTVLSGETKRTWSWCGAERSSSKEPEVAAVLSTQALASPQPARNLWGAAEHPLAFGTRGRSVTAARSVLELPGMSTVSRLRAARLPAAAELLTKAQ